MEIPAATARLETVGIWLYGFLVVALVAGNTGGLEPTTWGWCAVVTLSLAAIGLLGRARMELCRRDLMFVGSLLAFTAWVALSSWWSSSVTTTMHEVQRDLAYVGLVTAGVVLVRSRTTHALLAGVLAAIVLLSVYAVGTRVLPDRLGDFDAEMFRYRLATPITYWNGLGIFVVTGILLALGFALRGRTLLTRGLAGTTLPLLVATMFFSFSRAAWVALGIGVVVAVALDPRRLQFLAGLLVLAPFSAAAVRQADAGKGLTTFGASLQQATHDGHALAPVLVGLALASGAVAVGFALAERRVAVPRAVRVSFVVALATLVVLATAGVWARYGSPAAITDRAWSSFKEPAAQPSDATRRLFQLSNHARLELWSTAWESFEQAPVLGNGAGTFWQLWAANPSREEDTLEGHSLYLETLTELGIAGLALLVLALVTPLGGAVTARTAPLVAPVAGAYAAWLAHAGTDWDWELVGVSAPALLCGVALLAAGRRPGAVTAPAVSLRIAGVAACTLLGLIALSSLVADEALADGRAALPSNGTQALSEADRAARWVPWSSEPAELRGDAWRSLGVRESSRSAYRAAVDEEPGDWKLWSKLADVSRGSARTDALRHANALNPAVVVPASP